MNMWQADDGLTDVTSAFLGITHPVRELYDDIHRRGWTVQKVTIKDNSYHATAQNPHGEKIEATGRNEATAVGNLLHKVMRREHIRSSAQQKVGMWDTTFEDQLGAIAQAYAEAPTYDPKAAVAWMELAQDCQRRAEILRGQLAVEYVDDPSPYKTADELRKDVTQKKHVMVTRAFAHHPVWSEQQMLDYRLTHDVLGHCVGGGDWGWHGENLACAAHMPLLTENAQKALFTEALGQAAFGTYFRQWGAQKIAFLDDLIEKVQEKENGPGHTGVHPSQSVAPTAIPNVMVDDHEKRMGSVAMVPTDPNAGWTSGVPPMPDAAYLWQRDPNTGVDPLDAQGAMDNSRGLEEGIARQHPEMAKQAVANALRLALLGPRKNGMAHAVHFQHLMGLPANVDDPITYWDALERQRENWNQARGYAPESHQSYWPEMQQFKQWVRAMNPKLDDGDVQREAKREMMHMLAEEEERVLQDDKDGLYTAENVEALAYDNMKRRLKLITKPRVDDKHDFGNNQLHRTALHAGQYPSYLVSTVRPMAAVGRHADTLTDAALEDLRQHKGRGHHFRATALSLGIPQLGPRQVSQAWLHLAPQTSQLAVIDPHVMEVLGRDYGKEMSDRDYFKFERELAAGRDAAGYSHVPLGAFTKGLWDMKNGGPGHHEDLTHLRVLNPTPHQHVDWNSKIVPQEGGWPGHYWWDSTQEARDQVGKDWDETVAVNHPQGAIPFQPRMAKLAGEGPRPWINHPNGQLVGPPGMTIMQYLKLMFGHPDVHSVWAGNYEAGKA